jgi:glycine/D-amino acid oxidase-like deaminating enzyme
MIKSLLDQVKEQDIFLYNGLKIDKIEQETNRYCLAMESGFSLYSKRVVVCTNGFTRQLLPDINLKAARNQVILTEPIPNLALKGCFHYNEGYVYFRNVENRILLGGFRNIQPNEETTTEFGFSPGIQEALENFLSQHLVPGQNIKITHRWSGIMGVGPNKEPIIQEVKPNLWTAVRLGGMGIAIGTQVGMEVAEQISE